jgi:hypothetical protein
MQVFLACHLQDCGKVAIKFCLHGSEQILA